MQEPASADTTLSWTIQNTFAKKYDLVGTLTVPAGNTTGLLNVVLPTPMQYNDNRLGLLFAFVSGDQNWRAPADWLYTTFQMDLLTITASTKGALTVPGGPLPLTVATHVGRSSGPLTNVTAGVIMRLSCSLPRPYGQDSWGLTPT
jgi:hypothetical protein